MTMDERTHGAVGGAATREAFEVRTPVFAGPFRLLAELILDRKVDVCDVSIGEVTERFLAAAGDAAGWDLEDATWFVATGAVLLELKVGRLLPRPAVVDVEEDLLGVASPDLLYARSIELAAFRRVSALLARALEDGALYHTREAGPLEEFDHLYPDVMERVTPDVLARAAADALRPGPRIDLRHITPILASVGQAIEDMATILGERRGASFRELVANCTERIDVVVRFLALLELYREGRIALHQAETFGEIEVRWRA